MGASGGSVKHVRIVTQLPTQNKTWLNDAGSGLSIFNAHSLSFQLMCVHLLMVRGNFIYPLGDY